MAPLDFDFLKDRYDFELQRKEQLTTALALPVGVLGGLGSLLTVMVRTFVFQQNLTSRARVWLFWLLGFATGAGVAYIANHVRLHA